MWELLILLAVIIGVHWYEYQSSIQEYTFAQPATLDKHEELRSLLSEKTPIAVEIGSLPWRPELATKASWTVATKTERAELDMSVSQWLSSSPRPPISNAEELATEMELTTGLADIEAGKAWWWLPGLWDTKVEILGSQSKQWQGLSWTTAERTWIGCSHGSPLTLWLVHSRYRKYLPTSLGGPDDEEKPVNPWTLTVADAPWIGRVQYIEVVVKPGWCIGLPASWGYAVRTGEESWIWTSKQHSALSHFMTALDAS